jgi:hypothetical protein
MNWKSIQEALVVWVEAQSGLKAQWRDEAQVFQAKARLKLSILTSSANGIDETRWEFDGTRALGQEMVPRFCGNRNFTLSIQCETRDQRPEGAARHYLEKLRTSLLKPSVRALLNTAGVAYQSAAAIANLGGILDGREESRAVLDVFFSAVVNERDVNESGSFVEKIEVSHDLEKDQGNVTGTDLFDGSGL